MLNAICQAVTKSTMCDEEIHFLEHCTEILKVLIGGTTATPKVKKLWSHINVFLQQESQYATISKVIAYLPELQNEDPMARRIQKKLATPNINFYSGQSGEHW